MSENVIEYMRERWSEAQGQRVNRDVPPSFGGGGDGPHIPGMEQLVARVDGLEKRMDRVETKLDGIDTRLRSVEVSLGEIKGTLVTLTALTNTIAGKLPSWWQILGVLGALVSLILGLFALAGYFGLFNHHP